MENLTRTVVVARIKEVDGQPHWVPEEVTPNIEGDFRIDEDDLTAEMCRLGHLLAYYGNLYAELRAEMSRKEEWLKRAYAICASAIRAEYAEQGKRITDATVKEKVEQDERYVTQQADLQMTRLYAIMSESWWQSMKKKADLVIALAYKQGREMQVNE